MKAHIVGGGFGGLAAAGYLIRNAGVSGQDITIYEADERMGGGFFLSGSAESGYNLPGSVFDAEYRCTFDLLESIPSTSDPAVSVKDEFFAFNDRRPFLDRARLIDRNGHIVHGQRFGLSLRDGFHLVRLALTPEAMLDGRRIEEFFSLQFFSTEFWLIYSTIMGSLPQHSATELRRYLTRTLHLFPDLSDMAHILRTPVNQYQAFIEPLVAWLRTRGVNLQTRAFVRDIGFAALPGRITVNRLDYERDGTATSVTVGPEDLVLVTFGSQAADASVGSMTEAPRPRRNGRSWELWKRLAQGRADFGNPDVFFGAARVPDSHWVNFTVTTTGTEFLDQMFALTSSETGRGGLVSLIDSGWLLSLSIFHQPEVIGQPPGTYVWWGYGLYPERNGDFVPKRMDECTGAEILQEVLRQLRFDRQLDAIMASSTCIPCDLPYVNNIWMPRKRNDRPRAVPEGATNLGLIGQYVEVSRDVAFTIEYSARTAWEAIYLLLKRGPAPPPVYQAQYDLKALFAALKVFVCPGVTRP
jgi:oleate hydratase